MSIETGEGKQGEKGKKLVGAGAHPGSALRNLAIVSSMVEPFHKFLGQMFRDTAAVKGGPGDFLEEVQDKLPVLLWGGQGKSIRTTDANARVGKLSGEDVKQLKEAAAKAGLTLEVQEDELTLEDLKQLAFGLFAAVAEHLEMMQEDKCWKG